MKLLTAISFLVMVASGDAHSIPLFLAGFSFMLLFYTIDRRLSND